MPTDTPEKTPGKREWNGETLEKLRKDTGLTQEQLAWLLQSSRQAVSSAERNVRGIPHRWLPWLDVLADLAAAGAPRWQTFGGVPGSWQTRYGVRGKTRPTEWARLMRTLESLQSPGLLPGQNHE